MISVARVNFDKRESRSKGGVGGGKGYGMIYNRDLKIEVWPSYRKRQRLAVSR